MPGKQPTCSRTQGRGGARPFLLRQVRRAPTTRALPPRACFRALPRCRHTHRISCAYRGSPEHSVARDHTTHSIQCIHSVSIEASHCAVEVWTLESLLIYAGICSDISEKIMNRHFLLRTSTSRREPTYGAVNFTIGEHPSDLRWQSESGSSAKGAIVKSL